MFMRGISRIGGAIAGFVTGCLCGIGKGCCYNVHYSSKDEMDDTTMPMVALIGSCWGGVKFAAKGACEGATGGWAAGKAYGDVVHRYYYANVALNEDLTTQLNNAADRTAELLLSQSELNQFSSYLNRVADVTLRASLSQRLQSYADWLNTVCPLSHKTVHQHGNPVIVVDDQQRQHICSRVVLAAQLRDASRCDEQAVICGQQITAIHANFPPGITAFASEVKARLNVSLAMMAAVGLVKDSANAMESKAHETLAAPLSPRTVSLVKQIKSQGLWDAAPVPSVMSDQGHVAITVQEGITTPLLMGAY